MASGENVLWIVEQRGYSSIRRFVFRTRDAARRFADRRNEKAKAGVFYINPKRATWGPEQ